MLKELKYGRALEVGEDGEALDRGLLERCSRCGEWVRVWDEDVGYTPRARMVCRPCWPNFEDRYADMRDLEIPDEYLTAEIADFSPRVQRVANEWPDKAPFVGVLGGPGRGKTRLSWAIARTLHRNHRFVTFIDCRQAQERWTAHLRRQELVSRWQRAALLILDDITGGSISQGWRAALEKVLDHRKQESLPTLVVSMAGGDEVESLFGEAFRSRLRSYRWLNWPPKEPDRRSNAGSTAG